MLKIAANTKASYLRDLVFAANDGVITTFAIVAGSQGASLSNAIILILGVANLLADGISMASGNYLGVKAELAYKKANQDMSDDEGSPLGHGSVTFVSFVIAGTVPLLSFVFGLPGAFGVASVLVVIELFLIGYFKGWATNADRFKSGFEMLFVGGFAAGVAYIVGFLLDHYVL